MPNRILKESICASENIDQLSQFAEITFYRLMVNCDDYGRMDARPKILKSRLFPLKEVSNDQITGALGELQKAELITAYSVDGKPYLQMRTWDKHQQVRAKKSKYPSPDDKDMQTFDINCNQMISNDNKCPRNPIQSESLSESLSLSESNELIDDDDARKIQTEQNRMIDAAEDAGFIRSNSVRAKLIGLFSEYGLEKMLSGIDSCVKHGAPNLAYLEAVLKGTPKQTKPKVIAQDFNQRSYDGVEDQMMASLAKELEEFNRQEASG